MTIRQTKKRAEREKRIPRRAITYLSLGFLMSAVAYGFYLDRHIVRQFEGKRFALPARVYASPLELYEGKTLSISELERNLQQLRYVQSSQTLKSGQYRTQGNTVALHTRPFTFWDGEQEQQRINIVFVDDQIRELQTPNGQDISLIRLDPLSIGGIYPKQGEDRILVRLDQVPQHVIDALIALEDKRYYQHHGVDPKAIARALTTVFARQRVQGGSTLTQQLVKNFYLSRERTLRRKLKEMAMALLLELRYSKEDILETYINEVYFGQDKNRSIHGFGLASQFYFSRSIEHLNLHQSALLVGLLKGPIYYDPRKYPERAQQRRNIALRALLDQGLIEQGAFDNAISTTTIVAPKPKLGQSRYPAFTGLVVEQLQRDYRDEDLRSEGLRIFTTLSPTIQQIAESSASSRLTALENSYDLARGHLQTAIVIANAANGEVEALVGGRDTAYQGFNRALKANRQIGSLIKPAIFLTALEDNPPFSLVSPLDDNPFIWSEAGIEDWQPQNYDHTFHGTVPLWRALASSYNVATARLGTELGVARIMSTVNRLGIEKALPNYASGLLGTVHLTPYEVTQMYHTFASGGFYMPLRAIREVTTQQGEPLKRYPIKVDQVIQPKPAYQLTRALQQVVLRGTGAALSTYLSPGLMVAGKTGTTDELRDSWYAGFTDDHVAITWIGNDNNESIQLTGASGALTLWGEIMQKIQPKALKPSAPDGVTEVAIDSESGFIATDNCQHTFTLPVSNASLPPDNRYCSARKAKKTVKSWFKSLFNRE